MLTPEQVQQYRQQYNIQPTPSAGGPTPQSSANERINALKSGTYGSAQSKPMKPISSQEPETDDEHRNIIQKALGVVFDPVAKLSTHVGQLAGYGIGQGVNALAGKEVFSKEKGKEILREKTRTPITGTQVPGVNTARPSSVVKQVGGEALSSAALLTGSPAAAGTLMGAGNALENDKTAGGVALEALGGALGGKILDLGFKAVSPYVEKAIQKYGTPLYEKIAHYIPETAKENFKTMAAKVLPEGAPAGDKSLIQKGADKVTDVVENTLDKAGKKIRSTISPTGEGASYEDALKEAQRKLNPAEKYTPTERSEMLGNQTERAGVGMFKRDVPKITPTEEADVLAQMHSEGRLPKGNTPGQDVQTIQQEANRHALANDEYLNQDKFQKILVNGRDTEKVLDKVLEKAKKDIVFSPGSAEERGYNDVIAVAREEMEKTKGNIPGLRESVKKFNTRMNEILGKDIYTESGVPTTVGKARIQAAKDVRHALNDHIQTVLNDAHVVRLSELSPSQRPLVARAKEYAPTDRQQFIDDMLTEGSASTAESKFAEKTGTPYEGIDKSTVSESGLNVNRRSPLAGGTHGKGYSTTPEEDLGEIFDMAHESIASTKGDAFKATLKKEALLRSAADEIKYRAGDTIGSSRVVRFLNSQKGKAALQALKYAGVTVVPIAGGAFVLRSIGGE